ncbi:hypothetical protein [Entomohabitans teleogrylli]|uniref:hypothetical protein n=1 Tax=Entomohabitans teleogrylli TaxID=1384589 RepID=UPI00073D5D56|nr:hypothetical protein [Entomohabitans teleogrylli]
MTTRVAFILDDIPGQTGSIPLDITSNEIAVANIPGIIYWPYIDDIYGRVSGSSPQSLYDRMTDSYLGTVGAESFSITSLRDGTSAVVIGSQNTCWRSFVSTFNGGATFAAKVTGGIGISSHAAPTGSTFWIRNDTDGKLLFRVGEYTSTADDYDGPLLTAGSVLSVVFCIDTLSGMVTIRVGTTYSRTFHINEIKGLVLHPAYQFGLVNNENTLLLRPGNYGHILAFNGALTSGEMDKLISLMG